MASLEEKRLAAKRKLATQKMQASSAPSSPTPVAYPEPTFGEQALGAIETAGMIAGAAIDEPIIGLTGLGAALIPGGESGAEAVARKREQFAEPQSEISKRQMETLGTLAQKGIDLANIPLSGVGGILEIVSGQGLEKAIETIKAIQSGGVGATSGERVFEETGSPAAAAIATGLPSAIASAAGIKSARAAPVASVEAMGRATDIADIAEGAIEKMPQRTQPVFPREKRTQALIAHIQAKDASIKTLGKGVEARPKPQTLTGKFAEKLRVKGPNVVDRPMETEAVRQGYDKGIVADIKDATRETKAGMTEMLRLKQRGLDQARFSASNPPSNIVGDALMKRVNVVVSANKAAGKRIGDIAKKELRGKDIDIKDAALNFDDSLQSVGINIIDDGKGGFRADYEGSVLPKGDRGAINEVIRVMNIKGRGGKGIDAETVHDMKKILDNHISYGKTKDGLSGEAESILRGYRAGLDKALDGRFPSYDAANIQYAETIGALDRIQDVAGKKFDMHSPTARNTMGREMRKILSNYGSRQRLVDAVDEIEEVASKYKGMGEAPDGTLLLEDMTSIGRNKFKDDLLSLTLFDNELDARFVPSARGGFENLVSRKVTRAAQAASPTGVADMAVQAGGKIAEKVRGVTDETAIKSMFELLRSGN